MSSLTTNLSRQQEQQQQEGTHTQPYTNGFIPRPNPPPPPSTSRSSQSYRRHSLPFSFPPLYQSNASSTSLISSTAEGKPIPLDNDTTAHRTSALREINRVHPTTRHRYAKSTGAPNFNNTTTKTYSQPVIVRTYSGPPPSSSSSRPVSRRVPLSATSGNSNGIAWRQARNGSALNMARHRTKKKRVDADSEAKLPPVEAFSFKSIMADIQQDISADLDRIAEICARSRYSLSNQYEVHMTPHGSGAGFLGSASGSSSRHQIPGGPTLQAISADDESMSHRHRKRRSHGRRKSVAYGTLETIMSSSRSSEEDKSKKKSAAEIADEVRGRAAKKAQGEGSSSDQASPETDQGQENGSRRIAKPKSSSFATAFIGNGTRQHPDSGAPPRTSSAAVVADAAETRALTCQPELETLQVDAADSHYTHARSSQPPQVFISKSQATANISSPEDSAQSGGVLSSIGNWMPWKSTAVTEVASSNNRAKNDQGKSYAEGSLRHLLKTSDLKPMKGKAMNRSD